MKQVFKKISFNNNFKLNKTLLNNLSVFSSTKNNYNSNINTTPFNNSLSIRGFKHINDLDIAREMAEKEEKQRSSKFTEYTQKVYKPSSTLTFNREGEILLFSADNLRHSQIYTKYPFCLYNSLIALACYNFFANPFQMGYFIKHMSFYFATFCGWYPQYFYVKGLSKKIHKVFLLKGGKYCRVVMNEISGEQISSWMTISDLRLLNKEHNRFDEEGDFLTEEGQMKYEVCAQLDYFNYHGSIHNDETLYFMKEGTVHNPELFEQMMKGYNIDTTDYQINTGETDRWMEPNLNY